MSLLRNAGAEPLRSARRRGRARLCSKASGAEIAASFPGITRLGGQVVAALYLAGGPRSMDELSVELGRSKSNIFANLRGLEAAGIIERRREAGARHDSYTLRGKYPDVVIGAYIARLRRVVHDKQALSGARSASSATPRAPRPTACASASDDLSRKYDVFAELSNSTCRSSRPHRSSSASSTICPTPCCAPSRPRRATPSAPPSRPPSAGQARVANARKIPARPAIRSAKAVNPN